MPDLHYLDMTSIGAELRARRLSATELTSAILDRISRLDPKLHAYAHVMRDAALKAAKQADEEIARGQIRGPLHGIPVAVKDLCFTKNAPTASGTKMYRQWVPDYDATVVTRLQDAGAIILGKLEMTEGATGEHHPDIAAPVNPWGEHGWTGISSSGSGVAVAAGLCYGALGSDTGGSIRFPSACNGLTGIKPTWGRVSRYGIFPLAVSLDHIGPMTRSAADAAAMLGVIAGADEQDPTAFRSAVPDYLAGLSGGVKGLRIGLDENYALAKTAPSVAKAFKEALDVLVAQGAVIVPLKFPDFVPLLTLGQVLIGAELSASHASTFPSRADEYGPHLRSALEIASTLPGGFVASAYALRQVFACELERCFEDVDVIATPTLAFEVPTPERSKEMMHDQTLGDVFLRFTFPFNASGSPAISMLCGFDGKGLPIGLQLIGPRLSEDRLLRAAHSYQQVTDWHRQHPPL